MQDDRQEIAILRTQFSNINEDLKDIKLAITRSTAWLITTLLTVIVAAFSLAFWLGSWKGGIEAKLELIERNQVINNQSINSVRESMLPTIREEINNFADKNFIEYNK